MQFVLPLKLKYLNVDTLFSPLNYSPIIIQLLNIKSILAIHSNLIWLYPDDMPRNYLNSLFIRLMVNMSIKYSSLIIVDSKTAEEEIKMIFPEYRNKFKTVYLGVDIENYDRIKNETDKNTLISILNNILPNDNNDLIMGKYILSIVSSVKYHCIINLFKAYKLIVKKYPNFPPLIIISAKEDIKYHEEMVEYVRENALNNYIFIIDDINSKYIPALYRNSELYIFPSYCEVFGLTNLEAMACGVPVITSSLSAMPEVCGNAAVYFNPLDPIDIHHKIIDTFHDEDLKSNLIENGYENIKNYSWISTVNQTVSLITNEN